MTPKKTRPTWDDYGPETRRALAAIIANTRRVRRKDDLVSIAEHIEAARTALGSYAAVARAVPDLSAEMVRQFASVRKVCEPVRQLIRDRKLERVDVAHRLSKLPPRDQLHVAERFVAGDIDSDDVRAVVSLRNLTKGIPIGTVVERVVKSRDIKEYVARFRVSGKAQSPEGLRRRLAGVVGDANIVSLDTDRDVVSLVVNAKGRRRLQKAASAGGMTKRAVLMAAGAGKAVLDDAQWRGTGERRGR